MALKADSIRSYPVPNVRKLLVPDLGFEIASADLTGADAQTVAWEAGDEELKTIFKENKIKIHAHNALTMFKRFNLKTGYEQPYYDLCRSGVHLCNFLGGIDELAYAMGIPRSEAEEFREYWFDAHPLIPKWHQRVGDQLATTRCVRNIWGYERYFFDRMEGLLPDAIAWIAQSGTACITSRAQVALDESPEAREMDISLLMQVHDELVFQYPQMYRERALRLVHSLIHITVPYEDPLIIPWGLKTSKKSWGDCEKTDWPQDCQTIATMKTG